MDLGTLIKAPQNDDSSSYWINTMKFMRLPLITVVTQNPTRKLSPRLSRIAQNIPPSGFLIWWRTVYNNPKISDDNKPESKAARRSFLAKVATKRMRLTPWHVLPLKMTARALLNLKRLGMSADHSAAKEVNCKVTEFHTELIAARTNSILLFPLHDRKQTPMLWSPSLFVISAWLALFYLYLGSL
ncbi:hypothetical protein BofuT4_P098220.1 [Botrytis cinerea T4]|uniref:Uncharacterized protein n=1 Tax=Botryotinia fuckeliana (strain T4) TaxID=999810 RepID=G2YCL7_BOTF4|nr:hypothetical protein BofuT4_P098220.1 [Botrytis cinerea T4]